MTQETAPIVALRALMNYAGAKERQIAHRMGEAALAGRGFALWVGCSPVNPAGGHIFDAFADREACEKAMSGTVWAQTEAARSRSLAEACKIHGFEIVEVPAAPPPIAHVWVVTGDHWSVPGQKQAAVTSKERANELAAEIVRELVKDATEGPDAPVDPEDLETVKATAENWRSVLDDLQDAMKSTDGFGVTVDCMELKA